MRTLLAASLLIFSEPAFAGDAPRFHIGAPYADVRAQLIRQGFEPVRFGKGHQNEGCDVSRPCYPERDACAVDAPKCVYVFRRRSDGAVFDVRVRYDGWRTPAGRYDFKRIPRVEAIVRNEQPNLIDVDLEDRSGHRQPAPVAPALPKGIPYAAARARLLAAGFEPVPILKRSPQYVGDEPCRGEEAFLCAHFPEFQMCAASGAHFCNFLYRSRADGRFWIASTLGELQPGLGAASYRYQRIFAAEPTHLEGFVIATDDLPAAARKR